MIGGEVHLRRVLETYARYYNEVRTHRSLGKRRSPRSPGPASWQSETRAQFSADFITITSESRFSRHTAVPDGEAIVLRPDNTSDFEALRSRQGQAEAILVAYDMPLEARRNRLEKLLSRSKKAMRDGIQRSEAITGDGAAIFRHACGMDLEGIVSKRTGSRYVSGRTRAWLKTKNASVQRR